MRLIVLGIVSLMLGCGGRADVPKELVGKWRASAQAQGEPDVAGPGWTKEYHLRDDGTFVMQGYPPIHVTGKWTVKERDGNRFRVVLTEQKMRSSPRGKPSDWADEDGWAVLEGDRLIWQGSTFGRSKP